jgi:stage III sporulation protein AB
MYKVWGAFLVIGASTAWGCLAALRLAERCRLLRVWIWIMEVAKTEIYYQNQLLPEVFRHIAVLVDDQAIGKLFQRLAADVAYGSAVGWPDAWREMLAASRWKSLKTVEMEVLRQLSLFLGGTGRQDQLAKLTGAKQSLEQILANASAAEQKQAGLYRYLGFAAGVVLVLSIY